MDKPKFKFIGQLILDVITAVWLVILSALGSSCHSSGHVNADWDVHAQDEFIINDSGSTVPYKEVSLNGN